MGQSQIPNSTRSRILDAAEDLFASQGYQATTINQVASSVGIQGPAIYKHFASKRALFEEVLERIFAPFLQLVNDPSTDSVDLPAIMQQHLRNPNTSRIVQHATLSGGEDLALLVARWYLPFFADVLKLAKTAPGFSPVTVIAFHSMLLGYITLAPLHEKIFDTDPLHPDAVAELLALQETLVQHIPGGE